MTEVRHTVSKKGYRDKYYEYLPIYESEEVLRLPLKYIKVKLIIDSFSL